MIYGLFTLALVVVAQAVIIGQQDRELKRKHQETRMLREVLAWEADALDELEV